MAAADGADPELLHRLSRKPLWSALLRDFLIVATDGICEANEPGLRLAAAVYATIVAANAANPASAAAFGVQPRSRRSELEGRLVNFHQPHWLQSAAQRQLRISSAGMASTDSIPLALKRMDVDELVKAIGTKSMARLYHSYLDVNRALFRHVRHASTRIFNDSQSDLKNLTILYETGVMKHHPLESDIYKYLSGLGTSTYVSHLLSQTPIVVTGFTRTATSFRNNVKRIPSDHQWRLCAMTFVCLGGFPDLVFTGGLGVSANGKAPIPNHLELSKDSQASYTFECAILEGARALQMVKDGTALRDQANVRPVFPDWCCVQTLQASDYVTLVRMAYKFGHAERQLNSTSMLYHVCGEPPNAFTHIPPFPPSLAAEHNEYLSGRFCDPPPLSLWPKGGQYPKWPKHALSAAAVNQWWKRARVDPETYHRMWDGGAFDEQQQQQLRAAKGAKSKRKRQAGQ